MKTYVVKWEETVRFSTVVEADSPDEAIAYVKDGTAADGESYWTEWDDRSFVAEIKKD